MTMVPAEEAVEAFLDFLVTPFLPRRPNSEEAPTIEQQEIVAKQMYTVVVLYNYYHRKLFPELEFLDFKSFCRTACISKRSLLKYMKAMFNDDKCSGKLEGHLSITEKMIMDACDVSSALDALKDASGMKEWPISNIAVFLVDLSKEYCLLKPNNGSTQAIMSILEKDLWTPHENVNSVREKFKYPKEMLDDAALSIVEKEMGINRSSLSILGRHLSYSLSCLKSSSCLYIMSYSKPVDNELTVKEVMQSLQGPLVVINNGSPEATSVIRYYSLLPYRNILSEFLCKEISHDGWQQSLSLKADVDEIKSERRFRTDNNKVGSDSDLIREKLNNSSSKIGTINGTISKKKKQPSPEDLLARSQNAAISSITNGVLPTVNGEAKEVEFPALKKDLDILNTKKRKVKNTSVGSPEASHLYNSSDSSAELSSKKLIRDKETSLVNAVSHNTTAETSLVNVDSHNSTEDMENKFNQDGEHLKDMIVKLNCHDPVPLSKNVDLISILQILKEKRGELCQQQRLLEDNISHCEMSILTVLSGKVILESEIESMLKCDFLSWNGMKRDTSLSTIANCQPNPISRKRLCEAVLCLQNPCQELDEIFSKNNWMLPKYSVLPSSEGNFQALVSVRGMDFECDSHGDWKSNPREARESAASHMINKIRCMASQAQ